MPSPTFLCINPDGSNAGVDAFLEYTITQYLDKAGSFEGKLSGDYPVEKEGWLDVINAGKIVFRGFIDTINEDEPPTATSPGSQSIVAKDLYAGLDEVYVQFQEFPAGTSINDMLSSSDPTPGKVIGILTQLNGALPQGEAVVYSGETYKYSGYGTLSRCGTSPIYVDTTALVLGASKDTLARGQYWRDSQDLYVRAQDGRDPRFFIVIVPNYRDSRLRLGTISLGTSSFTVPYRIAGKGNFRSEVEKIILGKGLEMEFDHRAGIAGALGLSYINAKVTVGRGSLTAPVAEFKVEQVVKFNEETTGTAVNAIIGSGLGSGPSQVTVAKSNMMSRGHWRERTYSSSILGELLSNSLAKIWTDTSDARCWSVTDEDDLSLAPGDFIAVTPPKSQSLVKRAKKIIHKSDNSINIEINQRILEPEDYAKIKANLLSDMNSFIGTQKTSWSSSFGPTNIDDSENLNAEFSGSAKFTINIPSQTIDQEFATKFFIRLDIAAFEADLSSSETPAHNNGGATSSKTQSSHGVPSTTGDPQSSSEISVCNAISISVSDSRNTDTSPTYKHIVAHLTITASHGDYCEQSMCYPLYAVNATITGYEDLSSSDHVHHLAHTHSANLPYIMSDPAGHVHRNPENDTDPAEAQSHAVATEPKVANLILQFKTMKESGNSIHYLDVYVYLNNTQISGSPFPNLYLGDSIPDVDVTDQAIVGDNFLEIKIKEHTNSLIPVRCAIRGSLNASYYLNPAIL